jgi:2-hydroxychromene-2-carboxylate isomerase
MRFGAELDRLRLSVALDLRNPFAFLALRPAMELGRELHLQINWLPLSAQPLRSPSTPSAQDDRGVRHKRHRAYMIAREVAVYAEVQGLTVKEPYRDHPADAANLAWLWMRARAPQLLESFLEELFRRYWAVELDVGNVGEVAGAVSACGGDGASFLGWAAAEGPGVANGVAGELADAGVFQVPAYLVGDELFLGRQHLPMIRWLLEDRKGPVPI